MASDARLLHERESTSWVLYAIPAELRTSTVAHLESYGLCRRNVATLAATLDSISATRAPAEPSAGFVERVEAAADVAVGEKPAAALVWHGHVPLSQMRGDHP